MCLFLGRGKIWTVHSAQPPHIDHIKLLHVPQVETLEREELTAKVYYFTVFKVATRRSVADNPLGYFLIGEL